MDQPNFQQQISAHPGSLQIISAQDELFNHVDDDGYMWNGSGPREFRNEFAFIQGFSAIPYVVASLSGIDSSQSENLRFNLTCIDITAKGFTLVLSTWDNTRIARACVSWVAHGLSNASAPIRSSSLSRGNKTLKR